MTIWRRERSFSKRLGEYSMTRLHTHPKYSQFRFDAGSLALNFAATVRHRGSRQPRDLLPTPEDLVKWFKEAGCPSPAVMATHLDYEEALLLREAVFRVIRSLILVERPIAADMDCINTSAAYHLAVPQVEKNTFRLHWESEYPVRACLGEIARDAVGLIGGVERHRLKMCDNRGCQMIFFDNSPVNRRRWCAMAICGNREKIKAHRQRKRMPEAG